MQEEENEMFNYKIPFPNNQGGFKPLYITTRKHTLLLSKTGSTRSQSKGSYSASLVFLTVDAFRPDGYSGYERIFFL